MEKNWWIQQTVMGALDERETQHDVQEQDLINGDKTKIRK